MSYDNNNRLYETLASGNLIRNYYHHLGGIEKYEVLNNGAAGENLEYSFNSTGLVNQRKHSDYAVGFNYDEIGNLTNVTDPYALASNYAYNNLNRMTDITVDGKTFHYEYYDDGMVKSVSYPLLNTGVTVRTDYTYDNLNRLKP